MMSNIIYNTELIIRIFTVFFVCGASLIVFVKSKNMYKLTHYRGLKIFSYAFLYMLLGYLANFVMYYVKDVLDIKFYKNYIYYIYLGDFIAFSLITISALLLVYSLVWKDIERHSFISSRSVFNNKLFVLNVLGLIVGGLSSYYSVNIMFAIIIISLGYASLLAYFNYIKNRQNKARKFPQLYFIVLFLSFLISLGHFLIFFIPMIKYYVYLITMVVFLVILYGVIYSKKQIS